MKVAEQKSPELKSLADSIQNYRTAMMTMHDAQGQLSSQPMTVIEMDVNGCLWMLISQRGHTARATVSHDQQRKEDLWSVMARPWFPQGTEDPDLAVLKLEPIKAEKWDGPNSTVIRLLAMAASVVMGKPVGLGEHERHVLSQTP